MLGGIDNHLFLQAFGGFLTFPIIILFLRWAFPAKKDPQEKAARKAMKKELRAIRRR
jgi:hypothetical protein